MKSAMDHYSNIHQEQSAQFNIRRSCTKSTKNVLGSSKWNRSKKNQKYLFLLIANIIRPSWLLATIIWMTTRYLDELRVDPFFALHYKKQLLNICSRARKTDLWGFLLRAVTVENRRGLSKVPWEKVNTHIQTRGKHGYSKLERQQWKK